MADDAADGPGSRLKAAREGMEVSAREVADALNLPVRVIEALESNDYERLPPTVFTRGYLRSYARLLELPAEELIALYPEVAIEPELTAQSAEQPGFAIDFRMLKLAGLGVGGLILVILLAVWMLGGDGEARGPALVDDQSGQAAPVSPRAVPAEQAPGSADEDLELLQEDRTAVTGAVADPAPMVPGQPESAEQPEPAPQTSPPEPVSPGVVRTGGADRREQRITEFGDDRLTFQFERECWIEVKSVTGENLYSNLNPAGRTLELLGQAPFQVKVGFAPGVTLHFNGEPVGLTGHTRNNVANLTLGQ